MFKNLREDLGHPVGFMHLLSTYPEIRVTLDEPTPCIDASSVVSWHSLGEESRSYRHNRGELSGWKYSDVYKKYGGFKINRPEYAQISHCEVTCEWACDISDIHGFAHSKRNLRNFVSMDEMAETHCSGLINEITHEKLAENLAYLPTTKAHFKRYLWDGRLWLIHHDGSHRTAAAKYIASRLNQPVPWTGTLETYSLNAAAIISLCREFEMFVINSDAESEAEISVAFRKVMEDFKVTWFEHDMPLPYKHTMAILLPKSEGRSMRVAADLTKIGVLDLGAHLLNLIKKQARPS